MAKGNLPACLAVTLPHEGGYSDHPSDPGGATNMGITHITLSEWRGYKVTKAQVKALTLKEATEIYDVRYWRKIRGDDLPYGLDLATFDYGVNSGVSRASRYLQSVVGVKQDGVIGPQTVKAAILADAKNTIQRLCARRLSFLQGLRTFKVFGRGWSRRVADVEAKAVAMWLTHGATAGDPIKELEHEAGKAAGKGNAQEKGAGGVAGGGGAVGGGDAIVTGDPNWTLIIAIGLLVVVVAGALIIKSRQNKDRAEAYRRVAAAV